jgi:hypothetical protein
MKECLKDLFIEPFTEGEWPDKILGAITWILAILIVGGFLSFSLWLGDSSFLPLKEGEGRITNKFYIPAHIERGCMLVGKIVVPTTQYVSERYDVAINIEGLTDYVSLSECDWNGINQGQKICCKYSNGRISSSLYIKSFCK